MVTIWFKKVWEIWRRPGTAILAMVAGIIMGMYFEGAARWIEPAGTVYQVLLEMLAVVMLPLAVITGIARIRESGKGNRNFRGIIAVPLWLMLGAGAMAAAAGVVVSPFAGVDFQLKKTVSRMIAGQEAPPEDGVIRGSNPLIKEITSGGQQRKDSGGWFIRLLQTMVPGNIFTALLHNVTLQIVFSAVLMGMALRPAAESGQNLLRLLEGVMESFNILVEKVLNLLPLGIGALMTSQFRGITFSILATLGRTALYVYLVSLLIFGACSWLVRKYSGGSYFYQFRALKEALLVALVTGDSMAALPGIYKGLDKLQLNNSRTNLALSLGVTLCKYSIVITFVAGAIFSMQLYDFPITLPGILILVPVAVIAAFAALGSADPAGMISLALFPFGLPAAAVVLVLSLLSPILAPVMALLDVYLNCAAAALAANQ